MERTGFAPAPTAPTPSIKPSPVPWDPKELQGRTCINCACYFESANPQRPQEYQGFCRRSNSEVQQVRGQEPRLDTKTGQPVMKDGKPVMQPAIIVGHLYKAMPRDGTCFDGYRPKGTLPGETAADVIRRRFALAVLPILEQQRKQIPAEVAAIIQAMLESVLGAQLAPASDSADAALNS